MAWQLLLHFPAAIIIIAAVCLLRLLFSWSLHVLVLTGLMGHLDLLHTLQGLQLYSCT
eukprot:COSAG01_NODE_32908_length_573_cov_1.084388_1_plen_57_part_10